ncbi:MAG TPA: carbonic anhydrase [Longimicrobiales bacterium]
MPHRLIEGLRRYQREQLPRLRERFAKLAAEGQKPTTLFIGCSDSRVLPNLLTDSGPGEIFMVRNVGNFVPPFEEDAGFHGVSAAIEFAVLTLEVTDIVVCGHSDCGAIRALYQPVEQLSPHVKSWLELGRPAMTSVIESEEERLRHTERLSIIVQLERLLSFPMVRERVESGRLTLHGWYFIVATGEVRILDFATGNFVAPE